MRALGYFGLFVTVIILLVLAIKVIGPVASASDLGAGEKKAASEMKKDGDDDLGNPQDEIRGAVRDAYSK